MTTEWVLIGVGVLLILGNALFVAAEFSLVATDPAQVDSSTRSGRRVTRGLKRLSTELSGAQVGISVTSILVGYTAQPALTAILGIPLESTPLNRAAVGALAGGLSLIFVNSFQMVFGELVPKNIALVSPFKIAAWVTPATMTFTVLLWPVIAILNGAANGILRLMGIEPKEELSGGRSRQELAALVRRSVEAGTLASSTALLLKNTIDFDELTAIDVMTDRTRMVVLNRESTATDVLEASRASGHSRFPVIGDSHDDVLGLVCLRSAIGVPYEVRALTPAVGLMVEAARVPETQSARPLLEELRVLPLQMALVVDEYGGTAGLVTLEDVVEELVGEVADEHDRRRIDVHRTLDGAWSVPGVLRPDEVHESTGMAVPEEPSYETIGGFVMERLGRVPAVGDEVVEGGLCIRVERMEGRRVERVRLWVDE
ncbi:MAG: HlyC/CorC family transporter [Demequinaceae bacterium]|nr:HlyC/CorC family transporter [Demequinaceae bacterium]